MKKIIALILCLALLISGCSGFAKTDEKQSDNSDIEISDDVNEEFLGLEDKELLGYVENSVYTELVQTLDSEVFFVEGVETAYVSKEYLEEVEYNSKANIFFGYTLDDLDVLFPDTRYVFTLDESGQTAVEELVEIEDETYDKIIRNVAIGSGVILVCVTVAIVTKSPAATATAGKTVKMIFTASSMGAKAGTTIALKSAGIGGTAAAIMEAIRTNDFDKAVKAGLLGASEGFMFGAIFGTAKGIADGIKVTNYLIF